MCRRNGKGRSIPKRLETACVLNGKHLQLQGLSLNFSLQHALTRTMEGLKAQARSHSLSWTCAMKFIMGYPSDVGPEDPSAAVATALYQQDEAESIEGHGCAS